jgi:hypothetical protein
MQDLMKFMTSYHNLLDMRNLVTALHRLTKVNIDPSLKAHFYDDLSHERGLQLILRKLPMALCTTQPVRLKSSVTDDCSASQHQCLWHA